MAVLYKYKYRNGYYIRTRRLNVKMFAVKTFAVYQIDDKGLNRLRKNKIPIRDEQNISDGLFNELKSSGQIFIRPNDPNLDFEGHP